MNNSKKLKAIVLSMGLGVAMLTSTSVQAQMVDQRGGRPNGLFQENSQNDGLMRRGGNRSVGSTLNNESFGGHLPAKNSSQIFRRFAPRRFARPPFKGG